MDRDEKPTLLVVEDDVSLAAFLAEFLASEDFIPIVVTHGQEAINIIENTTVDLVLLDLMLPDIDGYTVLRSIRLRPEHPMLPVILMTARAGAREKIAALGIGADDYLAKPFDIDELLARIHSLLRIRRAEVSLLSRNAELEAARLALVKSYDETLQALARTLDARDSYTHSHSRAVTRYSLRIARELNLQTEDQESLARGALLHDIGKIAVDDAILRKPASLTEDEYKCIQQHPTVGCQMLPENAFLRDALPIVRHHHERLDGRGYPAGLRKNEIPAGARIVAVADAFHAMTSHRAYRPSLSYAEARDELIRNAGAHFDPDIVGAFTDVFDRNRPSRIRST